MERQICFDMDGTLADFYGVENWLEYLIAGDTTPYEIARPLFNFSALARQIHRLQSIGYEVNIISWTSKSGTEAFNEKIAEAKLNWLERHLPSVNFDRVEIIPYGTPKVNYGQGLLFDDEQPNRNQWNAYGNNLAFDVDNILNILRALK